MADNQGAQKHFQEKSLWKICGEWKKSWKSQSKKGEGAGTVSSGSVRWEPLDKGTIKKHLQSRKGSEVWEQR